MKKKQIIISICIPAIVFFLVSKLEGDGLYLRQLTATTMVRTMMDDLVGVVEKQGNPKLKFELDGDPQLKSYIQEKMSQNKKISFDDKSNYTLSMSVNEENGNLNSSLSIIKNDATELHSDSRSLCLGKWTSLLPPLLAIILAITLRKVLFSLSAAIWLGAMLNYGFKPIEATRYAITKYFLGNFIGDFSLMILAFVFVLVGMVNIINHGGGMAGVINQITKIAKCARTACVSAVCLGTLIFFDDYTNTIVVGTTMRSFTDKMRVSREKLAYIVDSTSAPLAGLAVLSTWIGFEVLQLHKMSEFMGIGISGYMLFLKALPFRFYCIFTIVFVFMIAFLRRDFGPMLKAERRASLTGEVENPDSDHVIDPMIKAADPKPNIPERWYNAAIPVASVIVFLLVSIFWRGSSLLAAEGSNISILSITGLRECFISIGGDGNTLFLIMLLASVFGIIVATILFTTQKILTLGEIIKSIFSAWRILPAAMILVLAWAIRQVCDDLGTAFFIASLVNGVFSPVVLPLIIFLIAAAVSFATGTSFGTMGLLIPTVAPLAFAFGDTTILVMSLGAVLDGSIFGDHCSPISDTTVLSALSSSCDLTDHVRTQMPYAVLCMIVAGLCGYLPAAYGVPSIYLYGIGIALLLFVLLVVGRNPDDERCFYKVKNKLNKKPESAVNIERCTVGNN